MSEYWKSVPRKFCDFCKCWLTDNKPSIEFHERGKRHQDSVARKLAELRKKGKKDYEAKKKMDTQFRKMNEAAMKAYQKDVERDPSLARELDEMQKAAVVAAAFEPVKPEPAPLIREPRQKKLPKGLSDDTASPLYYEVGPSNKATPYGQWVTVDNSGPVDFQLPKQASDTIEFKVVAKTPEAKFNFKEKTVKTSLATNSASVFAKKVDSAFKKRKFNAGCVTRNIRRKEDADDTN